MPRKFFKRISPSPHKLSGHRSMRWLGNVMDKPYLWRYSRSNICRAMAIGLFWAMIPMPFQMLAAALCAYYMTANLPISVALVWITNPLTMPVIYYMQYKLGGFLLNEPIIHQPFSLTIEWFIHRLDTIWQPFALGVVICAILLPLIGYIGTNRVWIWQVRRARNNNNQSSSK